MRKCINFSSITFAREIFNASLSVVKSLQCFLVPFEVLKSAIEKLLHLMNPELVVNTFVVVSMNCIHILLPEYWDKIGR